MKRAVAVLALALVSSACTPSQIETVRSVWEVAKPIVDCLLSSPYDDADTAILACGVKESEKPYAREIFDRKMAVRAEGERAALARVGACKK